MKTQSGFTLIEVIAAAVISTFIAGATISVLYFTNNRIKSSLINSRLSDLRIVISEQIRESARIANFAALPLEPLTGLDNDAGYLGSELVKEIHLYGYHGVKLSAYKIDGGYLWEGKPGAGGEWDYSKFRVGEEYAAVDHDNSNLRILAKRIGIQFSLQLRNEADGTLLPLFAETNMFRKPLP